VVQCPDQRLTTPVDNGKYKHFTEKTAQGYPQTAVVHILKPIQMNPLYRPKMFPTGKYGIQRVDPVSFRTQLVNQKPDVLVFLIIRGIKNDIHRVPVNLTSACVSSVI